MLACGARNTSIGEILGRNFWRGQSLTCQSKAETFVFCQIEPLSARDGSMRMERRCTCCECLKTSDSQLGTSKQTFHGRKGRFIFFLRNNKKGTSSEIKQPKNHETLRNPSDGHM